MDNITPNSSKEIILQTLEEGVFFLNSKHEIEDEYSTAFENILDQRVSNGQNFLELLKSRVPENIINNTIEFLNLMFREDLDDETVNELNPLSTVEFHFENRWGLWTSSKFLSFKFKRVIQEDRIVRLVGTVKDVTKPVTLTKKIEEIEETTTRQMDWLVNILRVAPPLLKEFVDVSETELTQIDNEMKRFKGTDDTKIILTRVIKSIHQMGNNASLLNLNFFTDKLHAFEQEMQNLRKKENIGGSDFVPAVIQLGEIRQMLKDIKNLMQRFKHYSHTLRPTRRFEGGLLLRTIENLVEKLARELNKQIKFNTDKFDHTLIPYSHQEIFREFLIILIKFSIFYGIETPEDRRSNNKKPEGILEVETFGEKQLCGFKLRHDGRLVRIERLLQKTIEMVQSKSDRDHPIVSDQLGSEVIRLLFMPSLATPTLSEAEYIREIFGEMEMVKKKLKMHRGKIKITFTSENFCEYTISLPVN